MGIKARELFERRKKRTRNSIREALVKILDLVFLTKNIYAQLLMMVKGLLLFLLHH